MRVKGLMYAIGPHHTNQKPSCGSRKTLEFIQLIFFAVSHAVVNVHVLHARDLGKALES